MRTTCDYDLLNRLVRKSYSSDPNGTPSVTYTYDDMAVTYGVGRLKKVSNGISTTTILAYYALGRVLASQQSTGGKTYNLSYSYNLSGASTSEMYPSGRQIATRYDGAAPVSKIVGNWDGQQTNYLKSILYMPHGGVWAMQMGNNVWRAFAYTAQLQTARYIDVVNNDIGQTLLDETLYWGTSNNNGI